jgi:hypothetical protein
VGHEVCDWCRRGVYKTELIDPRRPLKTREEVEIASLHYVDWFNNTRRYEDNGGTRLRITRAYRSYRARVPSR